MLIPRNIIYTLIAALILSGCSQSVYILPLGNVAGLNTTGDERSFTQILRINNPADPCLQEFMPLPGDSITVLTSDSLSRRLFNFDSLRNIDAISLYANDRGFISFSHPPGLVASKIMGVPISGAVGGTDIFEFSIVDGKINLSSPGQEINTKFWESHPYTVMNGQGDLLLIWSSDRPDHREGFSSPYFGARAVNQNDTIQGNSDLYYAFRKNGIWSEVRNFSVSGDINTSYNEITPSLYCLCHSSMLLFASDRDSVASGDFDIYAAEVSIDFENGIISQKKATEHMKKGTNEINTVAKEYFPLVLKPYKAKDSAQSNLYFSSDRYSIAAESQKNQYYKNVGGFDLYSFPFNYACRNPKIKYHLYIRNAENPDEKVISPYITLFDSEGRKLAGSDADSLVFELNPGESYSAAGGSHYNQIQCTGASKVLSHYSARLIKRGQPHIRENTGTVEQDSLVNAVTGMKYDTVAIAKRINVSELSLIKPDSLLRIASINVIGDSAQVDFIQLIRREFLTGGNIVKVQREVIRYDTIPTWDTIYAPTYNKPALSELSAKGLFGYTVKSDTSISDTIFIYPSYYRFPPCRWEFIDQLDEYSKNVPYFMTGYWEVNTSENLERHLKLLTSKDYSDASFIELHPRNQYFGYIRPGIDEEQQEKLRARRNRRIGEYEAFAKEIDKNIKIIADKITDEILPAFDDLLSRTNDNGDKLVIQLFSYSDIRPVTKGNYNGESSISYISSSYDEKAGQIHPHQVIIKPGASIVSENNETLSQLRAYFGYRELLNQIEKKVLFKKYADSGLVLLPDMFTDLTGFEDSYRRCRILFLIEGRQVDAGGKFEVPGYVGREGDYFSLDPVRRINVIVNRVELTPGGIKISPCCSE